MSTFGIANIPDNRSLMATVGARIRADARMLAATATFWRLLGFGGFLLLAGIGVGLGCFGYSYITDQRATMDKLTTAIADALNKVTLKTDGTVKLTEGTVKLDTSGASVRLDTSGLPRPTAQQLAPTAQPQSQAKVVTDYTVFKNVKFGLGFVHTEWRFESSEDATPSSQYCYYDVRQPTGAISYDIANDGVMLPATPDVPISMEQAFANCVWFGDPARIKRRTGAMRKSTIIALALAATLLSSAADARSGGHSSNYCTSCARDAHGHIARSPEARHEFMRQTGYRHGRPGYVIDHVVPLKRGGADAPSNMQWQTKADACSRLWRA